MRRPVAYGCLALSMTLVGSYVALSKPLTTALPVFLLAWLRFGIAGIAMLHWLKRPAGEAPMSPQTRWLVFLESFVGNFMFSICMLFGVSMTTAVSAGVIMAGIPAAVATLSWIFLREQVSRRVWGAVICAVAGIGLLAWSSAGASHHVDSAAGDKAWLGNLLVFCAVLCEAAYAVIGKKLSGVLSPRRISSLINLWGFLLMTPMGIYAALKFDFGAVHPGSWVLLIFYSLAASIWTVWLWMTGLTRVPANLAGIFTVMLPISATLVGVLVLGEKLSAMQVLAFAIATVGVLMATLPSRQALKRRYTDG